MAENDPTSPPPEAPVAKNAALAADPDAATSLPIEDSSQQEAGDSGSAPSEASSSSDPKKEESHLPDTAPAGGAPA